MKNEECSFQLRRNSLISIFVSYQNLVSKREVLYWLIIVSMLPEEYCLTVVVVGATNLKNVSTFGKLDPFVEITYANEVYKTSVIKDGGCSPGMIYLFSFIDSLELWSMFNRKSSIFKNWRVSFSGCSFDNLEWILDYLNLNW